MKRATPRLISLIFVIFLLDPASTGQSMHQGQKKAPISSEEETQAQTGAPLFNNLGNYHHKITTKSSLAQRYFDQGLILAYGFNHGEAIRSFKEAARLDPSCGMCYWGVALALGPNINKPMEEKDAVKAWKALQQAETRAVHTSQREQAYINALAKRYSSQPVADRRPLDVAYANAMRDVMQRYPNDLDAATLFAEAMMDTIPWDYYTEDKRPKPVTDEITKALESVIARDPLHPGANHFYIHAVEASRTPERALPSAARLGKIAPGAGHLVHMPSHVYLRVGRYHDATLANERAVDADESYIGQCRAQGFYPVAYYPHNQHFLWYTAGMEGRSNLAIETAREIDRMNERKNLAEGERFSPLLTLTLARFGRWSEVLAQPRPPGTQLFEAALDHYARGMAHSAKLEFAEAQKELAALGKVARDQTTQTLDRPDLPGGKLILLSHYALAGEIASRRRQADEMIKFFTAAIEIEDQLPYMEPPYWHQPVRQLLGAGLLEIEKPVMAETVYRKDLERHPANGWSLYGLLVSLRAQGKTEEANDFDKRFREAWQLADVTLTASRF
jgi:tetratricopeptide (TPR) repeat protein